MHGLRKHRVECAHTTFCGGQLQLDEEGGHEKQGKNGRRKRACETYIWITPANVQMETRSWQSDFKRC
jgi:hypothetical protein